MAVQDINAQTLAQAAAMSPDIQEKFWSRDLEIQAASEDHFAAFEGPEGSNKPIALKQELSAGRGQEVTFTTVNPLRNKARVGDQKLEGNEEALRHGQYKCYVDVVRHAAGLKMTVEEFTAIGGKLDNTARQLLAKWFGQRKQTAMLIRLLRAAEASGRNIVRPGNATTDEGLTLSDTLSTTALETAKAVAKTNGARPGEIGYAESGAPIHRFMAFGTDYAFASLESSPSYKQAVRESDVRGKQNRQFLGGLVNWAGDALYNFSPVDSVGTPVGCPLLPKAYLGTAIAAGTTGNLAITGGGSATDGDDLNVDYYESFPNFDYLFYQNQTPTVFSTPFFVVIYNLTGADAGKWGFYRVLANNGNRLTTVDDNGNGTTGAGARLAAAVSGKASTKIGNVTWDSARNTDAHPPGSLVFLANSYAVPLGSTLYLGAMAGVRAYGSIRNKRFADGQDYGMVRGVGAMSIFGEAAVKRSDNVCPNFLVIRHAVAYPGVDLNLS
jgi:N4-gp56 family major capsid protein